MIITYISLMKGQLAHSSLMLQSIVCLLRILLPNALLVSLIAVLLLLILEAEPSKSQSRMLHTHTYNRSVSWAFERGAHSCISSWFLSSSCSEAPSRSPRRQHHVDFVRCDNIDTANSAKNCMQQQWSDLVSPGCKVKVKLKGEIVVAIVEKPYFISKLYFDCL